MTPLEFLKQFPNYSDFSRKSKLLLFAFYLRKHKVQVEFGSKELRECFDEAMLRVPSDLSSLLKTLSTGRDSPFIRSKTKGRHSLSIYGQAEVEKNFPAGDESPEGLSTFLSAAVPYLRRTIAKVEDEARREFLAEAISCASACKLAVRPL